MAMQGNKDAGLQMQQEFAHLLCRLNSCKCLDVAYLWLQGFALTSDCSTVCSACQPAQVGAGAGQCPPTAARQQTLLTAHKL